MLAVAEDEGVTSGFSSRPLSLPPSEGPWQPGDHLPPTPHKRVNQSIGVGVGGGVVGGGGGGGGGGITSMSPPPPSLSPSPSLWLSEDSPKWSHNSPGGPLTLGLGLGQTPEEPPTPHKRACRGGGERVGERGGGREVTVKMKRSASIPRSSTIVKGINSLEDLEKFSISGVGGGRVLGCTEPSWLEIQPLLPAILVTTALFLWCLRYLQVPAIMVWILPDNFFLRFLLKFLFVVSLLAFAALLLRIAFPSLVVNPWLPETWQVNLSLDFNLNGLRRNLGPALRKGAKYLHLTRKDETLLGYYTDKKGYYKSGKSSSGHGTSWNMRSVFDSPRSSQKFLIDSFGDNVLTAKVTGCGVHSYSNGDRYEGEFYQGKCSGSGVYYFAMSGRYEGDWVDGKYDGYGVETWSRGSRYRGQYRQGLREGYGIYRFYTGDVYSGLWSKGQSHGVGIQTCADGSRYVGEFAWGAKHGYGKYVFRNGDVYSGEYFADKMHGYGVYVFGNGHRYEGAWHEGRKQGLGCYTFRNGETRAGFWNKGALETRSTHSATSASPTAVNHSRVLHSVQEARRASTKAENVLLVEDRVSKAVAGANRSAVAARVAAVKATQESSGGKLAEP